MSTTAPRAVTVIRLVRLGNPRGSETPRVVVSHVVEGALQGDLDDHTTYLIVPSALALTRRRIDRRHVSDIRVGDIVGWVAESSYGVLWVADRAPERTPPSRHEHA
jgi:hypothetical protein